MFMSSELLSYNVTSCKGHIRKWVVHRKSKPSPGEVLWDETRVLKTSKTICNVVSFPTYTFTGAPARELQDSKLFSVANW